MHLNYPALVELNQVVNERESVAMCLLSKIPTCKFDRLLVSEAFCEMIALLGVAQSEMDFIGECDLTVLTEHIHVHNGSLSFCFDKEQSIGYDVTLMNFCSIEDAKAFDQLGASISSVIWNYDVEKILNKVSGLIQGFKDDMESIDSIKSGSFYTGNVPFRQFVDLALKNDDWNESNTKELYLNCYKYIDSSTAQ